MKGKTLIHGIALSLLLVCPALAAIKPEISEKMTGQALPSFSAQTTDGKSFTDKNAKSPMLINFFASWCPPCRKELTDLRELNAKYGKQITFLGVLIDPVETPDTVKDARLFLTQNPLPYAVVMMNPHISKSFKFEGIPTVYLVDKNRKFATTLYGPQQKQTIEQHLQKLVYSK